MVKEDRNLVFFCPELKMLCLVQPRSELQWWQHHVVKMLLLTRGWGSCEKLRCREQRKEKPYPSQGQSNRWVVYSGWISNPDLKPIRKIEAQKHHPTKFEEKKKKKHMQIARTGGCINMPFT